MRLKVDMDCVEVKGKYVYINGVMKLVFQEGYKEYFSRMMCYHTTTITTLDIPRTLDEEMYNQLLCNSVRFLLREYESEYLESILKKYCKVLKVKYTDYERNYRYIDKSEAMKILECATYQDVNIQTNTHMNLCGDYVVLERDNEFVKVNIDSDYIGLMDMCGFMKDGCSPEYLLETFSAGAMYGMYLDRMMGKRELEVVDGVTFYRYELLKGDYFIKYGEFYGYNQLTFKDNSGFHYMYQYLISPDSLLNKSFCSFVRLALSQFIESEEQIEKLLKKYCERLDKEYVQSDVEITYISDDNEWSKLVNQRDTDTMKKITWRNLGSVDVALSGEYLILNKWDTELGNMAMKVKLGAEEMCLCDLAHLQDDINIDGSDIVHTLAITPLYKLYQEIKHRGESECHVK